MKKRHKIIWWLCILAFLCSCLLYICYCIDCYNYYQYRRETGGRFSDLALSEKSIKDFFFEPESLILLSATSFGSIATIWGIYFFVMLWLKYKQLVSLWVGVILFALWSLCCSFNDWYLRVFIPVGLSIAFATGAAMYTMRDK